MREDRAMKGYQRARRGAHGERIAVKTGSIPVPLPRRGMRTLVSMPESGGILSGQIIALEESQNGTCVGVHCREHWLDSVIS